VKKMHLGLTTEGVAMSSYAKPLFSAAILVMGLSVTGANAGILVSGTNAVGVLGQTVYPTYTIDTFTEAVSSPVIDVKQISGWDFELNWNPAALEFKPAGSSITVNGINRSLTNFLLYLEALDPDDPDWNPISNVDDGETDLTKGKYRFSWFDQSDDPSKLLDIGSSTSSILFTAAFEITSEAVIGTSYDVNFGLDLKRSKLLSWDVSQTYLIHAPYPLDSTDMQVTVKGPTPTPEPGMLVLLLGGMASYLGAVRLRRGGRG
jgi:hypothetical protein